MSSQSSPQQQQQASTSTPKTYTLVTVNTAPERAQRLIGRVAAALAPRFVLRHVANCAALADVPATLERERPDLMFCASMWTPQEAEDVQRLARRLVPGIRTHAIPHGLQVEKGPDAVVEYLVGVVPGLLGEGEKKQEEA